MNPAHEAKRAKDSDRTEAVEVIDTAYADGQLTLSEREHRTHSALTAATLGELHRLTSDLQAVPVSVASAVRRPRVLAVVAVVLLFVIGGGYAVLRDDNPRDEPGQEAAAPAEVEPVEAPVEVADRPVIEKRPLKYSFTPKGVRNFRELYREKFGTTQALGFGFSAGEVDIALKTPDGPWHWGFADGHFVDAGGYSDGPEDGAKDRSFPPGSVDLADLDIDAAFDNLEGVKQATGRSDFPTLGISLIINDGRPTVAVAAGDKFTTSCQIRLTTMSGKVLEDGLPCVD
ncbi:hypothetical protein ASG90_03305 [Nocardioides sp. Soil797]|nr:hypothetical protein ASG90_03305 [Nocardioides sp. Soil797]